MTLTAAGVGSGIDVESILSQLSEINRQPVVSLENKIDDLDVELSAFGSIKSALNTFQTAVDDLGSTGDFGGFAATSSDESVFTATASGGDVAVNQDIEVLSLAKSHQMSSAAYESSASEVTEGTLQFSSGENSFDIEIDASNNTLAGLKDAINDSEDNESVSASIINVDGGSRLILTAIEPGTESEISVSRAATFPLGDTESGFTEITEASDASLRINGFEVTRSSNTISDVIEGVTLNLTGEGEATVDSRRDLTSLKEAMDEFVTQYNAMSSTLSGLSEGNLQGDSLTRGIDTRMRAMFFSSVDLGGGDSASALDMGFSFDRYGELSIDTDRYEDALELGVNRFVEAFTQKDTGVASMFSDLIDEYSQTGGIISDREGGIDIRKSAIEDQIERMEYRLEKTDERLRDQFTAMDLAITELNTTSGFLSNLLTF